MRLLTSNRNCVLSLRSLPKSMKPAFTSIFLAISLLAGGEAKGQSTDSCLPWPATAVPFDSIYYVSGYISGGDRLVVGNMSTGTYSVLRSQLPAPSFVNQKFCGSIKLASGVYASAYVPTAAEWTGNFTYAGGILRDPFTGAIPATGAPFPLGIIPSARIPDHLRLADKPQCFGNANSGIAFCPCAPCRVADTRESMGSFGMPQLSAQATRDFVIPDSNCGIPANAQAYSMNFTVVVPETLDYITVFPTGQPRPLASLLNSYDGRTKANAAIIPAGSYGAISVFATHATDLLIDINGYFVPNTDTTALAFYPVAPCRLVETRENGAAFGSPQMSAGEERRFPVLLSSCGVPPTAQAYSLNYTVVPSGPLAYLTTWPSGRTRPLVSTLNAPTGGITANSAIVPAGDGGDLSVFVTGDTQLIVDINGYFAPPTSDGLSLFTTTPCRVYDSRMLTTGQVTSTALIKTAGTSSCGQFPGASSFVVNSTVVPNGPLLYLSLWGDGGGDRPNTSVLNAPDGVVTSNMAIVPTTWGSVNAYVYAPTQLILDVSGYFAH